MKRLLYIFALIGCLGFSSHILAEDTPPEPQQDDLTCKGICCTEEGLTNTDCVESDPEDLAADYMLGDPNVPDF